MHRMKQPARGLPTAMAFLAMTCMAGIVAGRVSAQQDEEEIADLGITEYELSCMPCHGVEGRGDGVDAALLPKRPADLTRIAQANGGVFPADRVANVIDGRAIVATHGPREMPVWGDRYRRPIAEEDWDTERDARSRIDALVGYLASLQE